MALKDGHSAVLQVMQPCKTFFAIRPIDWWWRHAFERGHLRDGLLRKHTGGKTSAIHGNTVTTLGECDYTTFIEIAQMKDIWANSSQPSDVIGSSSGFYWIVSLLPVQYASVSVLAYWLSFIGLQSGNVSLTVPYLFVLHFRSPCRYGQHVGLTMIESCSQA